MSTNKNFKYDKTFMQIIKKVTFNISSTGKYKHTLTFKNKITLDAAIKKIEEFLSTPITIEYYNEIKDDVNNIPFENIILKGDVINNKIINNLLEENAELFVETVQ